MFNFDSKQALLSFQNMEYHLACDKITYEKIGNDKIYYTYSSSDNLVSMKLNGVEYFYIRNGQGDIVGLLDSAGTQVVSYVYDTWGKLISITGSLKDTVGVKNPYRYRSYRYDTETGLYYLQSRYYNPEWGRFINADSIAGVVGELLSHNIFEYCKNNPVMMKDPSGFRELYTANPNEETPEMRSHSLQQAKKVAAEETRRIVKSNKLKKIASTVSNVSNVAGAALEAASRTSRNYAGYTFPSGLPAGETKFPYKGLSKGSFALSGISFLVSTGVIYLDPTTTAKQKSQLMKSNVAFTGASLIAGAVIGMLVPGAGWVFTATVASGFVISYAQSYYEEKYILKRK